MDNMNQAMVSGELVDNAEISKSKAGQEYGHFLLMQKYKSKGKTKTRYFPCFTSAATVREMRMSGKADKGSVVFVQGVMDPQRFTDSKGESKTSFSLKLCTVFFLDHVQENVKVKKELSEKPFSEIRRSIEGTCDDDYFESGGGAR